jgi:hypothetical protein
MHAYAAAAIIAPTTSRPGLTACLPARSQTGSKAIRQPVGGAGRSN